MTKLLNELDGNNNPPVISPQHRHLLAYQSDGVRTYLAKYPIQNQQLQAAKIFVTESWGIEKLVWIDERRIAVAVCAQLDGNGGMRYWEAVVAE